MLKTQHLRTANAATRPHHPHHAAFAAGTLIHLGAITAARVLEQKFEVKDPIARTLMYSAMVTGASYVTMLLRSREREQAR